MFYIQIINKSNELKMKNENEYGEWKLTVTQKLNEQLSGNFS